MGRKPKLIADSVSEETKKNFPGIYLFAIYADEFKKQIREFNKSCP